MNILIAADIFPPQAGGPATYAVTLANELVKQEIGVLIVSLNPHSDRSAVACPLFPVSFANKYLRYLQYFWLLFRHGFEVDLFYAMGPVNAGWPASVVARLLRKKLVVKVVGDYAWEQGQVLGLIKNSVDDFQKKTYGGKVGWLHRVERRVVRAADLVITPSEYLRDMVRGWGAEENKIKRIYNTVQLPSDISSVKKPAGERWVVSIGRLVPWKGVEVIMRAVKELSLPDLKFKVIGDGPERRHLEQARNELGLGGIVEFLGNLPHDSALTYMAAADLVVLNSGYEGLSHTLLEARFLGRTAIASRVGGNPEVIPEDHLFSWNVVAELQDAIVAALSRPAEPVTPEFAAQFRFETMIAETKQALEKVCAG